MKLKVPFYKQESKNDCGPVALRMVLEYLGEPHSREELINLVDSDKSGVTWTLGLARAVAKMGFKTEFYTTCLGFNPKNYELEYYQKEADKPSSSERKLKRLQIESHQLGVKMEEKSLTLKQLISKISKDCVPIVLLDWNRVRGKESYQGHFVPIVGYDDENIYVHNHGEIDPKEFVAIKRDLFDEARKSKGTDEEIVFIHKKE
jgi:hypothetical protein